MTDIKKAAAEVIADYEPPKCPAGLLGDYELLSRLSEGYGTETFLVSPDNGETLCVAKCYDKQIHSVEKGEGDILSALDHPGLPHFLGKYEEDDCVCVVREYIIGVPLDRFAAENQLTTQDAVGLCLKLADILSYLHGQTPPVIHRDIKPQNIIVKEDGSLALIDFDISRVYNPEAETDTQFFGTRSYAAPEQYGFMQTDCRADIFSFGVLLRWLVTGSERKNDNIRLYKPVAGVIEKCTAFSPDERYQSITEVRSALKKANPKAQRIKAAKLAGCIVLALALLSYGGVKLYNYLTFDPFAEGNIPATLSDGERIADAVSYLHTLCGTDLFNATDDIATIGDLRTVLVEVCGLDEAYVWAMPTEEFPGEYPGYFLPWGLPPEQYIDRDLVTYAAVKAYWPEVVADWSSLPDDNGYYPGARVAAAFAEEHGILTGANRPGDLTLGDVALIFANAQRVYAATLQQEK